MKRTHRRIAAVAGVALAVGFAGPASAIFVGTTTGTGVNVDPGGPSATVNVVGLPADLAFPLGLAGSAHNAVLSDVVTLNTVGLANVTFVNGLAAPYAGAALGLTGGVVGSGLALSGGVAGSAVGIAGGVAGGALNYLNMNSAPAIIAAAGGLL